MSQDDTKVWLQENLPHLSPKTGPVPSANLPIFISTQFDLGGKDKEQASQYWLQYPKTSPCLPTISLPVKKFSHGQSSNQRPPRKVQSVRDVLKRSRLTDRLLTKIQMASCLPALEVYAYYGASEAGVASEPSRNKCE